jgi:hypothetical protein
VKTVAAVAPAMNARRFIFAAPWACRLSACEVSDAQGQARVCYESRWQDAGHGIGDAVVQGGGACEVQGNGAGRYKATAFARCASDRRYASG